MLMLLQIVIYLQLLKLFNFSSVWEHVYIKHDKPFSHYYIIPVIILWHSQITFSNLNYYTDPIFILIISIVKYILAIFTNMKGFRI